MVQKNLSNGRLAMTGTNDLKTFTTALLSGRCRNDLGNRLDLVTRPAADADRSDDRYDRVLLLDQKAAYEEHGLAVVCGTDAEK